MAEQPSKSACSDAAPSARWPIVVVVLIALVAMGRSVTAEWSFYDDDLFLTRNPHFNPPTPEGLAYYWANGFRGLWTPLTQTTWWLIAQIAYIDAADGDGIHLNPWTFHAANVLLHAVASGFAYALLRAVIGRPMPALAGAIIFAAHPIQVEAVAWTCGTKDVLAGLFGIVAVWSFVTRCGWHGAVLVVVCCGFAMLSKPSAIVLAGMMFVFASLVKTGRSRKRLGMIFAVVVAMAISIAIVARVVQDVDNVATVAWWARPVVAVDALGTQLLHVVWPASLCADPGLTPAFVLANASARWPIWVLAGAVLVAVGLWRDRIAMAGLACFVVALLPNLGLTPFQFQVYSTVADRYAYLAMIGIALIVVRLATLLSRPRTIALIVVLGVGLSALGVRQCGFWRDASTIWARVLAVNPRSSLAHNNLGAAKMAAGDLKGALDHFQQAAAGAADAFAWLNLAQVNVRLGRADAAAEAVVRLMEIYHARTEFDPKAAQGTIDYFGRAIRQLDPTAAEAMAATLRDRGIVDESGVIRPR